MAQNAVEDLFVLGAGSQVDGGLVQPSGLLLGKGEVRLVNARGRARAVASTQPMPSAVDVVVVGGGMVGTMAALTLAERGIAVALCEKGVIAGEASGRAQGFLYSQYADLAKAPMLARSKSLWRDLPGRTGREIGYRADGLVSPLDDENSRARAEAWLETMRDAPEFQGRILSASETSSKMPGASTSAGAALFTPTDGAGEPVLAVPAIAETAREKGAVILQQCAVRGIETAAGRVSGVVTEHGPIACQSIILATGAWTPRFTRHFGIRYAQADVYMSLAAFSSRTRFDTSISHERYGFRRRLDGSYSFGAMKFAVPITPGTFTNLKAMLPSMSAFKDMSYPAIAPYEFWRALHSPKRLVTDRPSEFEERRILAPGYFSAPIQEGLRQMRTNFPAMADATIVERWAGILSTTFDNMPVISAVAEQPGLFVGSGFSNGFTFGPAAGEALADLATGGTPAFDLHRYRLGRFSDGTPLQFYG